MSLLAKFYLFNKYKIVELDISKIVIYLNSQELGEEIFDFNTKYVYSGFQILAAPVYSMIIVPTCSYYEHSVYFFNITGSFQKSSKLLAHTTEILEPWRWMALLFILFFEEHLSIQTVISAKVLQFSKTFLKNIQQSLKLNLRFFYTKKFSPEFLKAIEINEKIKYAFFNSIGELNAIKYFQKIVSKSTSEFFNSTNKSSSIFFDEPINSMFFNYNLIVSLNVTPLISYFTDKFLTDSTTKLSKFMVQCSKLYNTYEIL